MSSRDADPADLVARVLDLLATAPDRAVFVPTAARPDGGVEVSGQVTVAELYDRAALLAVRLTAQSLAGRRVALAVHIGNEAAALYLACQLAGVAPAMLPVPAHAREVSAFATVVAPLAAAFSPELVIFDRQSFELVHAAGRLDSWRGDPRARVVTEAELGDGASERWSPDGQRRDPGATAHYLFTSGTTGRSKVVRLSRAAVARNTLYVAERWGFGAGDRLPVIGPPYHSAGLMVGLVMPLYRGAAGVFAAAEASPHPLRWLRLLDAAQCTHLACGDGLLRAALLGLAPDSELRYSALRAVIIGGEPLDQHTYDLVEQHFAPRAAEDFGIYTAYGMTEAAGLISTSTRARPTRLSLQRGELDRGAIAIARPDPAAGGDAAFVISCGSPSHGVDVRVVDAAGQPLGDDTIGRVEFRSDCLFDGYVGEPAEAAAADLRQSAASLCTGDQFFPTGDLGFRHAGELFIRGRLKEAIPIDAALLPAERIEAIARSACVAVAGHHGIAVLGADAAGRSGEPIVMQELANECRDDALAAARSIAESLFRQLALRSVRILLFAPDSLPRLCTSAKKVRILAAAALERGELAPAFSARFVAPDAGSSCETPGDDVAWSTADLERDHGWLVPVTSQQAAALARAVSAPSAVVEVDAIRGAIDRALQKTSRGVGFAVLRGLPADLPLDALERMVAAIGAAIGRLMPQNPAGQPLTHVRDRGSQQGARGYLSNEALAFHSDTTDVLALFCVRNAMRGGDTALVSSLRVFRELAALDARDALAALRAGFLYAYPDGAQPVSEDRPARRGAETESPRIPVFSDRGGRISCRYLRAFIELAEQRHAGRLTDVERHALDLFDRIAARPDLQLRLRLEPGDLLLVNNYCVLHSRSEFDDDPDESRKRLLLRLWINVPGFRPLIPALQRLAERFVIHHTDHHVRPELRDSHTAALHLDRGGPQT